MLEGAILTVRLNEDSDYCLTEGKYRTIRLWNPHRGIHIKTYKSHGHEVHYVHVTFDNLKICYWDLSVGRVIGKFRGHDSEVNVVKFNEYLSVVVSAVYDRSLRAWDCRSHNTEPIQIIETFLNSVMSICLTKTEIIVEQPVNCISLSNDSKLCISRLFQFHIVAFGPN